MVDDEKEHPPLHQLVVEKVHFLLRHNHLTIEHFLYDIDHVSEIIKENVAIVEYCVNYYKDELIATQFRFKELKCKMANLENDLEIKTEAHHMSIEQYEIVLNQHDIIAKDNCEMYAQINTKINSYKASKTFLKENSHSILNGPKPSWIKYGLSYDEMNKQTMSPSTQLDFFYVIQVSSLETMRIKKRW